MEHKFEVGLCERGKNWCVYIDGIPWGPFCASRRAAQDVCKWLSDQGFQHIAEYGKETAFEEIGKLRGTLLEF